MEHSENIFLDYGVDAKTLKAHFLRYVNIPDNPAQDCWLWQGSLTRHGGYGQYYPPGPTRGVSIRAHRVAYELFCGPIPEGLNVLHRCDTPACVSPHHLWAGTQADNIQDAMDKGRIAKGERVGSAKLTEADVVDILHAFHIQGQTMSALARAKGVGVPQIHGIIHRKRWAHVLPGLFPDPDVPLQRGERGGRASLTEADIVDILRDYSQGDCSQSDLARRYRVTPQSIADIVYRRTWNHVLPGEFPPPAMDQRRAVSKDDERAILDRARAGESVSSIILDYPHVSRSHMYTIARKVKDPATIKRGRPPKQPALPFSASPPYRPCSAP